MYSGFSRKTASRANPYSSYAPHRYGNLPALLLRKLDKADLSVRAGRSPVAALLSEAVSNSSCTAAYTPRSKIRRRLKNGRCFSEPHFRTPCKHTCLHIRRSALSCVDHGADRSQRSAMRFQFPDDRSFRSPSLAARSHFSHPYLSGRGHYVVTAFNLT